MGSFRLAFFLKHVIYTIYRRERDGLSGDKELKVPRITLKARNLCVFYSFLQPVLPAKI